MLGIVFGLLGAGLLLRGFTEQRRGSPGQAYYFLGVVLIIIAIVLVFIAATNPPAVEPSVEANRGIVTSPCCV